MFLFNFVENEPQIDQRPIKGDLILFISFCSKISTIKIIFLEILKLTSKFTTLYTNFLTIFVKNFEYFLKNLIKNLNIFF